MGIKSCTTVVPDILNNCLHLVEGNTGYGAFAGTPKLHKTSSFRDSAMETASVDTAYQPGSSQRGNSLASVSPSSSTQRPRRRSDAGPAHISIDIPPTPSVPPSAASSYDSTYYASHAEPAPLQTSQAPAQPSSRPVQQPAEAQASTAQPISAQEHPAEPQMSAAIQPRQEAAPVQSPLGGMLGQLGSPSVDPATPSPQNLLAWLDMKDRQVVPPLLGGVNHSVSQTSIAAQEEPSALFKHQEAAEVCKQNHRLTCL